MDRDIYNRYSEYLKKRYGQKVYKLPISLPVSCPNRQGQEKGCTYCDEKGAGFEILSGAFNVKEQLKRNMEYIGKKYKADKFIAYFQNFTNTYMDIKSFNSYMKMAVIEDVVEISVSTRPDCIRTEYLDILNEIKEKYNINITIELGLQSVNYHTLLKVNRGHTLAEFIDAVLQIKKYNFQICTHIILNLPWDDMTDVIENSKVISSLGIDYVKLHALYIAKNTVLAKQYENKEFDICTSVEYEKRVVSFLLYLSPEISIQRLIGRAPEENTIFSNWGKSWWKIRDNIENEMQENNLFQGKNFNYLGGKSVKKFFDKGEF